MAASLTAMAQTKPQAGLLLGLNLATQTADVDNEKSSSDIKPGLAVGAFVNLPAGKNFSVQPALLFSMLGGYEKDGEEKVTTTFNYIMLPVLAKLNLKGVSIYAGPQLGFLMSAKATYEYAGEKTKADIKDGFKSTDFMAVAGAEVPLGGGFALGANYQAGLSNIFKDGGADSKYHNSNIQIHLAWKFPGKKKS